MTTTATPPKFPFAELIPQTLTHLTSFNLEEDKEEFVLSFSLDGKHQYSVSELLEPWHFLLTEDDFKLIILWPMIKRLQLACPGKIPYDYQLTEQQPQPQPQQYDSQTPAGLLQSMLSQIQAGKKLDNLIIVFENPKGSGSVQIWHAQVDKLTAKGLCFTAAQHM